MSYGETENEKRIKREQNQETCGDCKAPIPDRLTIGYAPRLRLYPNRRVVCEVCMAKPTITPSPAAVFTAGFTQTNIVEPLRVSNTIATDLDRTLWGG